MTFKPGLIALDLDGTLLNKVKKVSPRNTAAVNAAIARGIHVCLASGRTHEATSKYAAPFTTTPEDLIISYNGARVGTLGGELIYEKPVSADQAAWLIDYAFEHDLHLNFYTGDTLYVSKLTKWSELYQARTGTVPNAIGDLRTMKGKPATKLIIVDSYEKTNSLLAPMKEHFGSALYITKTDDEYLEFMNAVVDKGEALSFVAQRLGVARENTAAFGDNYNDLPMLAWAGCGVAMSNGKPDVLRAGDEIAPGNDDDGVAQVIERWLAG
ncbi:MAG: Cof-type HAD-IIB family hydrolase [Capsulimonadaceae bacterium]|nr:Cof-type HAD-IIB family hydrolase [Capsulimonadaceae bacterium]